MSQRIEDDEEAMEAVRLLDRKGYSISDVEMAWTDIDKSLDWIDKEAAAPPPTEVIDLMEAPKASLAKKETDPA